MDLQQKFGNRLASLLEEKNIKQADFADRVGCSRQSINFYILGKRSPDISLTAQMAKALGVSCDYLIGYSDYRLDKEASLTASGVGLSEEAMKVFAGLKLAATCDTGSNKAVSEQLGYNYETEWLPYAMQQAQVSLSLLNALIAHDKFGILLQYIKQYHDICKGDDELAIINDFMVEIQSTFTSKKYGTKEEQKLMKQEFCLHVALKYFDDILRDIAK